MNASNNQTLEAKVRRSPSLTGILAAGAVLSTGFGTLASLALGGYGVAAIEAAGFVGSLYLIKYVRRYEANRNVDVSR